MGKKARKTRWRTLAIADEYSDSEESNITTTLRLSNTIQPKPYYNKFPYSDQSTPRRKQVYDSTKSTRSSSSASENKITFNEDEYTRITTPRQDVLFKKGYLNKPRTYQNQTSTGNSTTSTGNSTGNGTPDHQSTDLEYESQFVFPNAFLDQNGIYYVNGYEPYPLMLYNPPTYYSEFSNNKSKRYSTGSLTESTSPNNEEATSQDMSGGETSNNVSDYSGHHHVYNMVYPGYYVNGVCQPQDVLKSQSPTDSTRRIKKRRRRKSSKSQVTTQDSTECSDGESECEFVDEKPKTNLKLNNDDPTEEETAPATETVCNGYSEGKPTEKEKEESSTSPSDIIETVTEDTSVVPPSKTQKYDLKPDAEEFIPRAYRSTELTPCPVQFIKVPSNFVPIPIVPFSGQNFNPAFIPPGIPVNFLPPDQKFFPNYVEYIPNTPLPCQNDEDNKKLEAQCEKIEPCNNTNTASEIPKKEEVVNNNKAIDIATVVSKLEEAAKEQNLRNEGTPKKKLPEKTNPKYRNNMNYKKNYYNNAQVEINSQEKYRNNRRNFYGNVQYVTKKQEVENSLEQSEDKKNPCTETPQTHVVNNSIRKNLQSGERTYKYSPKKQVQVSKKKVEETNIVEHENTKKVDQTQIEDTRKIVKETPAHVLIEKKDCPQVTKTTVDSPRRFIRNNPENFKKPYATKWVKNVYKKNSDENSKRYIKNNSETTSRGVTPNKPLTKETPSAAVATNAWISVSNRKKRKNKNLEDVNSVIEEATVEEDLFEDYDVNELVDVVPPLKQQEDTLEVEVSKESVEQVEAEEVEDVKILEEDKTKNKAKKTQKPLTKRVMITDVDLSDKYEKIKSPIKKVVRKVEKPALQALIEPETTKIPEQKKSKKKKKKSNVSSLSKTNSSSSATLNNFEDSYDFLLEAALVAESQEKTNDEISEELDRVIQKSMYSSLEVKVKSLNIEASDGFFKSMFDKIGRETNKTPDFPKLLQNTRKPSSVSEDYSHLHCKPTNKLSDLDSAAEHGVILEQPTLTATPIPKIEIDDEDNTEQLNSLLYPITEAVKEWMCRTRETTPDVEILKSPSVIFKELRSCEETETVKNVSREEGEEEITVFSTRAASDELQYWEDDIEGAEVCSSDKKNLEEDEVVLEVYQSKYGRNEDFLNIRREVMEGAHGFGQRGTSELPYRAVCCNIM